MAVARFKLPERLGFGQINAPVMFDAEWRDGRWGRGRLLPYGPIELWPGSRALQYASGLRGHESLSGRSQPAQSFPRRCQLPPPAAVGYAAVHARRARGAFLPGHRRGGARVQSDHADAIGTLAVPAAVPVRHRKRLHAAKFAHVPLHGHRAIPWRPMPRARCKSPSSAPKCARPLVASARPRRRRTTQLHCVRPTRRWSGAVPSLCGSTVRSIAICRSSRA